MAESQKTKIERANRYKSVIGWLSEQTSFDVKQAKSACKEHQPAAVTRIVNELEREGWIVRDGDRSATLRWNSGRGEFDSSKWMSNKLSGTQITESPTQERPRERLLDVGPQNLRNAELIAILIRSGRPGESAVMAGEKLAKAYHDRLADLPDAGRPELKEISHAIEKTAYCQIMAGIELGRRITALKSDTTVETIGSASDAIRFCQRAFARLSIDGRKEEFHIVTLDTRNHVINTHMITVGTLDASLVHPREVFRPAIRDAAASVILVHNHPSGDCTPSPEDRAVTARLESAGEILGIDVLDHIVLGRDAATSLRESAR